MFRFVGSKDCGKTTNMLIGLGWLGGLWILSLLNSDVLSSCHFESFLFVDERSGREREGVRGSESSVEWRLTGEREKIGLTWNEGSAYRNSSPPFLPKEETDFFFQLDRTFQSSSSSVRDSRQQRPSLLPFLCPLSPPVIRHGRLCVGLIPPSFEESS